MNIAQILGSIGLAIVLLGVLIGCLDKSKDSPVDTVESYIDKIPSRDISECTQFFTPPMLPHIEQTLEGLYLRADDIEVSNVLVTLIYEQGINARVRGVYDITITVFDQITTERIDKEFRLIKNKNKWYINQTI